MKTTYESVKWADLGAKEQVELVISIASFISAIVIGVIALFMPPQGIIDKSVLFFTAQLLVFVSTLLGINLTIDGKNQYFSSSKKRKQNEEESDE